MTPELDGRDVARVLAGETDAFTGIVQRWQGPLVNLAFRFCGDHGTAEEMAQEAFLKAYRSLGQWRREAAFSTWLFALATNVYRSALRRRRLPSVPLEAVGHLVAERAEHGALERRERRDIVQQAVRLLPSKYREAVVLFYFHEMDLRQTAATLGMPPGTVKSHLFRARKLLENHLGPILDPDETPGTTTRNTSSKTRSEEAA